MKQFLSTKEVADFLNVNEKMIYALISEKGLPAARVTGKWLFPTRLVEQWIENNTLNFPEATHPLPPYEGLLIITGSNDPLLDRVITLFNQNHPEHVVVFGNLGSMGGLTALRRNLCHIASSHLLQEGGNDYNFEFASRELDRTPAIINFALREQGIVVAKGNPRHIGSVADLAKGGIRIVNRPLSTGTRLLFDRELQRSGIRGDKIPGYENEVSRHFDVGIEILAGRADAGLAIRSTAALLGLGFIPLCWERYDLLIRKEQFFNPGIQAFLGMLHEPAVQVMADTLSGYDLSKSGRMIFPNSVENKEED